jgi:hypothetical protein
VAGGGTAARFGAAAALVRAAGMGFAAGLTEALVAFARGGAFLARTFLTGLGRGAALRPLAAVRFTDLDALALVLGLRATLAGFALPGARFMGPRDGAFAVLRAAFFTFFLAMQTFSSNRFQVNGLTYGCRLTDNRQLSAIPRAATDSPSKLEIRPRAAQEAPILNGKCRRNDDEGARRHGSETTTGEFWLFRNAHRP